MFINENRKDKRLFNGTEKYTHCTLYIAYININIKCKI